MEGRQMAMLSVADRKRLLGVENNSGSPGNWLIRSSSPSHTHSHAPTPSGLKGKRSKLCIANKGRMANKPPLAPKPGFVPNGSPRRKVPPPIKPVPYAQHKQSKDSNIKPSQLAAPRSIPPEVLPKPPRGSLDKGKPSVPACPVRPLSPTPPKVPDIIDRRPRLGTPMTPPEPPPELFAAPVAIPVPVQQNGIRSDRARSPGVQKTGSPSHTSRSPSHASRSPVRMEPGIPEGEVYAEAYNTTSQEQAEEEQEAYTVVRDLPRRRTPQTSPERTVVPDTEYSLTSHVVEARKLQGKMAAVQPGSLPDEYSLTSHVVEARKLQGKMAAVQPGSLPDEYSLTSHVVEARKLQGKMAAVQPGSLPDEYSLTSHVVEARKLQGKMAAVQPGSLPDEYSLTSHVVESRKLQGKMAVVPPGSLPDEYSLISHVIEARKLKEKMAAVQPGSLLDEYSLTSHVVESRKLQGKNVTVPPPTLPGEYSTFDRPEKRLSPVLIEPDCIGYSVLDIPEDDADVPRMIPTVSDSYEHLDFSTSGTAEAEPQEDVEEQETPPHDARLKALSAAKPPFSPRTKARKASLKSKLDSSLQVSRDRSVLPAYTEDGLDPPPGPRSTPKPVPPRKPRRQHLVQQSGTETGSDFHSRNQSGPSSSATAMIADVSAETQPVNLEPPPPLPPPPSAETLEDVGYETWRTFSPPPDSSEACGVGEQRQSLTMTPMLVSPKCEIDIDQLVAAAAAAETTSGSSPLHSASARPRDHMYDEIVEVPQPKPRGVHSDASIDAGVPGGSMQGHKDLDSLDPTYKDPDAAVTKERGGGRSRFVFPAPESSTDLGPLPVVVRSEGVGAEKQPSEIKPASPNMDCLGYTEIDIQFPVQKKAETKGEPPKPKPRPKRKFKPKDSIPNPKDSSPNEEVKTPEDPTNPNPKDSSPNPKDSSPNPKDSIPNPKDSSPIPKDSSPNEEVKTREDPTSPAAGEGGEDIYVSSVLIHTRKEQAKKNKEAGKDPESTGQKMPQKPLGPPRRRPPPPPINTFQGKLAVAPVPNLKISRSHSNEVPTDASLDELRTASKSTSSPKHKDKGIFSRAKSRSLRTKPASPSSVEEKTSLEGDVFSASSPKRGSTPSQSPSIGKRFRGLVRRGSKKVKSKDDVEKSPETVSPSAKSMTLPSRAPIQRTCLDDFGIYSVVQDPVAGKKSLEAEDDILMDADSYAVIDPGDMMRRQKKKTKRELRKSASMEHLYESAELDQLQAQPAAQGGGGAKSACNSPQLQRRRRPPVVPPLPYRSPMDHIATLPRRRPAGALAGGGAGRGAGGGGEGGAAGGGAADLNVDLTQLYATVTKQPKSKKKNKSSSGSVSVESELPKSPAEEDTTPEVSPGDGDYSLPPETAEQGLPSSEIDHTIAGGGQEYAMVCTKKRRSSGDGLAAEVLAAVALRRSEEESVCSKGEESLSQGMLQNRPPKPPRSNKTPQPNPPSPAGEILPKPPKSNKTPLPNPPPTAGEMLPKPLRSNKLPLPDPPSSAGEILSSEMHPRSPSMSGIRQLSSGGPPSFPPPPPPQQDPDSPPGKGLNLAGRAAPLVSANRPVPTPRPPPPTEQEDETGFPVNHTYEIPALEKERYLQESQKNPAANFPGKSEGDSQTEPEVPMVQIDEALKDRVPKQRNPHMYEDVEEKTRVAKVEQQAAEFSLAGPEVDVMTVKRTPAGRSLGSYETVDKPLKGMKRQHVYDIVPEFADKSSKPKKRKSRLPPRNKPPPAPPTANGRFQLDDSSQMGSPQLESLTPPDSEPSPALPATEPLLRKRIHVEIAAGSTGSQCLLTDGRPQFLFPKSHSQSFIEVGQHDATESTPSPSQSSSTLSGLDDETDSTEWETSSGEEEEGPSKPPRPKTYYIAQEVLTTERTFVKGLTLLHKDFRQTVQSANRAHEKPVIADEVLRQILGNVGSLLTLNSGLLNELEERMEHWEEDPRIGDILLSRAPYMKLYTDYISRFDKALKTLEEAVKKNPVFAAVVREFEAQPKCANLPLASYMLETVQRVPRYKMLLADYIKHLPDGSVDRAPSEGALEIISATAIHVNETIRQMDNFRKVMEVRKKLIGDTGDTLITPYRKLLKEGELLKYSRKEKQPRMFFLFSDILIYASSVAPANTTFKALKRIPLDGMRVESLDDPEMRHGFQIVSTCKSFRLEATSASERELWLTAFEQAINEHKEHVESRERARQNFAPGEDMNKTSTVGHLAPPWLPDSTVSMCQLCSVPFTVTRRRHHCRGCGMIFCADCSAYLAPLKYKGSKLGRVCQTCYERICNVPPVEDSDGDRTPVKGRQKAVQRSQKLVNLPSVLREVKARDQNAQLSGYLLSHTSKTKRWKKKWFMIYNLVMYEFERHEDVTAKRSITLPSYQVISPVPRHDDPLVFCLRHPGCGKSYFKADNGEQLQRWIEVLQKAVKGEIGDEPAVTPPEQKPDPFPPDQNPDPESNQQPDPEPDQKSDEVPEQKSDDSGT